uniref:N-acetylneuraminate synthase family protein n=1 Tax=Seleniivibrio woodruffii TaxID=1078050 RepID=UPI0039E3A558
LNMQTYKIPSGEITNLRYLQKLASLNKKYIISTGMSDLTEVREALEVFYKAGVPKEHIIILHANTQYPTPFEDVNLLAMSAMGAELGLCYGYSDHTAGIEVPVAAAALGASVIEKHFTLDRNMEGPDHKASLEPQELAAMVRAVRNIEKALGSAEKKPSPSESGNRPVARKSLVARYAIRKGELFSDENLTAKRPGTGISPMRIDELIGRPAERDYQEDELI